MGPSPEVVVMMVVWTGPLGALGRDRSTDPNTDRVVRLEGIEPPALRSGAAQVAVHRGLPGVSGSVPEFGDGARSPGNAGSDRGLQGIRDPVVIPVRTMTLAPSVRMHRPLRLSPSVRPH